MFTGTTAESSFNTKQDQKWKRIHRLAIWDKIIKSNWRILTDRKQESLPL